MTLSIMEPLRVPSLPCALVVSGSERTGAVEPMMKQRFGTTHGYLPSGGRLTLIEFSFLRVRLSH